MIQKESANQVKSISLSLQGFAVGIVLIFPALFNVNFFGVHIALGFLPVAAVFLWPRAASYSWSLVCVFLIGILYDTVSVSPLGMWTLALLILYMVLGGGNSHKGGLGRTSIGFSLSVLLCLMTVFLVGKLFLGQWPRLNTLLINAGATLLVFPIIYWIRSLIFAFRGASETPGVRL